MAPKSPTAAHGNAGAPSWLVKAGIEGGWLDKTGKPTPPAPKKPAKAPGNPSDNSKQYRASHSLSDLTAGFGGLELSSSPSIDRKGEGKNLTTFATVGHGDGEYKAPSFKVSGFHKPKAPTLHFNPGVDRAGSNPSRAAGAKPKTVAFHKPDVTLQPGGVVLGDRTYKLGKS